VPTARRSRTIDASAEDLWRLISDPYHLPRWWPRVARVEGVEDGAFTEVMRTSRGKTVRADFDLLASDAAAGKLAWSQRIAGTPFARLLESSETHVSLSPTAIETGAPAGTQVTIELRQTLSSATGLGYFFGMRRLRPGFGSYLVRRAAAATLEEALDGLERINGSGG
jgi:uncharacterized protein YndB with AHSA1/START domain